MSWAQRGMLTRELELWRSRPRQDAQAPIGMREGWALTWGGAKIRESTMVGLTDTQVREERWESTRKDGRQEGWKRLTP